MNLVYKKKIVEILTAVEEFQKKSKPRKWLKERLKETIDKLKDVNRKDKAAIYDAAFTLAINTVKPTVTAGAIGTDTVHGLDLHDPDSWKELVKTVGKVERRTDSKQKIKHTKEIVDIERTRENVLPVVFYACSIHGSPAKDHADYQGKIYVDRYWRKYAGSRLPDWLSKAIEDYIHKNDIMSIQKIMGPPVWLGTRPYCKHFFIPVKTLTVLTQNKNEYIPKTYARKTKPGATYEYIKKHFK